jgi:hypothetical protein
MHRRTRIALTGISRKEVIVMCQLLGFSSNKMITDFADEFMEFRVRGSAESTRLGYRCMD